VSTFLTPPFSFLTPLLQNHHECGGKIIRFEKPLVVCWCFHYFCGLGHNQNYR